MILDTNAFLYLSLEPARLSRRAASALRREVAAGTLAVASITLWEVALLARRGRIRLAGPVDDWLERALAASSIAVRELTPAIAVLSTLLPEDFPRDPADRIIAATAQHDGVPLVTSDERIRASPVVATLW